jgi:hypothetical protein
VVRAGLIVEPSRQQIGRYLVSLVLQHDLHHREPLVQFGSFHFPRCQTVFRAPQLTHGHEVVCLNSAHEPAQRHFRI